MSKTPVSHTWGLRVTTDEVINWEQFQYSTDKAGTPRPFSFLAYVDEKGKKGRRHYHIIIKFVESISKNQIGTIAKKIRTQYLIPSTDIATHKWDGGHRFLMYMSKENDFVFFGDRLLDQKTPEEYRAIFAMEKIGFIKDNVTNLVDNIVLKIKDHPEYSTTMNIAKLQELISNCYVEYIHKHKLKPKSLNFVRTDQIAILSELARHGNSKAKANLVSRFINLW